MDNHVFIIAEMSANHNGSLQTAIDTIKAAKEAGADAVKLQTYTADTLTLNCRREDFMTNPNGIWAGQTTYSLFQKAFTPWEWHEELYRVAREEGLVIFSSPFDKTAVDLLESLDTPMYKIASPEINDVNLISLCASKHKPMIISTGVATADEINEALAACRKVGNDDITLLKCTTEYPAPIEKANLKMIPVYKEVFGVKAGLSDHTMGSIVPVVATALGATMIEKHFIIDRSIGGPDSSFSMNKEEFAQMVKDVRMTEKAIGNVRFPLPEEINMREHRSLYVAKDMKKGDVITEENVRSVRPGYGLAPKYLPEILGKRVNCDLEMGERMSLKYVDN